MTPSNQFLSPVNANINGKIFDYAHADQLFVASNYRLAPKYSYLYYVKFDRDDRLPADNSTSRLIETGQLVSSVSLPKFSVDNKVLNAYNRPNNIQTKIKYDPVQITFHDDSDNTVLDFWREYYNYHYRDGDYKNMFNDSTTSNYQQKHKYHFNNSAPMNSWGYTLKNKSNEIHFLKNIRIYSLNRGTFTEYILVNPLITSFQHGQHTAGENALMTHTMTVSYEAVLYYTGNTRDSTIPGMLDLHYDKRPSSLTPTGLNVNGAAGFARPRVFGARGVFGNGGILDTSDQIIGDIGKGNLGGALVKGFKAYQNNKGANLKDIAAMEAKQALIKGILTGTNPFSGVNIPVISNLAKGVGGAIEDGADWASKRFGVKQASQDKVGSAIGQGYAAAGAASVSYEAKQKLNTDGTSNPTNMTSNGESVSTNKPEENVFNSPTFRLPKDETADINADFQPVVLNGSVQGPNNASSLRRAQNQAAGNEDDGANYEPPTASQPDYQGSARGYTPYYARTMNNTPREENIQQGVADAPGSSSPIPGLQGGGGGVAI
jgi:hypothetical protein